MRRPLVIGVVNLTEDSFSDGGRYLDPGKASEHALRLLADGADVIELGPASSHPDARSVASAEEIRRLQPVLERLQHGGCALSVDSYQPETQRFALTAGVDYLNDIRGFPDVGMYAALAASSARLIAMHSIQRGPATRQVTGAGPVLASIDAFFAARIEALTAAGVARERLILDPGMGFFLSGEPGPSLGVLRELPALRERFGCPLLVSVSRKSFLGALTGRAVRERGAATLAAEIFAAQQGVDYLRTHDVRALRDALAVLESLASG